MNDIKTKINETRSYVDTRKISNTLKDEFNKKIDMIQGSPLNKYYDATDVILKKKQDLSELDQIRSAAYRAEVPPTFIKEDDDVNRYLLNKSNMEKTKIIDELNDAENKLNEAWHHIDSLHNHINLLDNDINSLKEQIYELNAKKDQAQDYANKFKSDYHTTNKMLKKSQDDNLSLSTELDKTLSKLKESEKNAKSTNETISNLNKEIESLRGTIDNITKKLEDSDKTIESLKSQLDSKDAHINKLSNENKELLKKIDELTYTINNSKSEIDKLTKTLEQLQNDLNKCDDDLNKCYEDLKKRDDELNKCNEDLKKRDDELNKCNEDLKKRDDELNKCNEDLKKCKDELKEQTDLTNIHKKQVEAGIGQLRDLQRKYDDLEKICRDSDIINKEVLYLRSAYTKLLFEVRNRLELANGLNEKSKNYFTDDELKNMSSDPNSQDYITNKLFTKQFKKEEKVNNIDHNYYTDKIEGIDERIIKKVFTQFTSHIIQYIRDKYLTYIGVISNKYKKSKIDTDMDHYNIWKAKMENLLFETHGLIYYKYPYNNNLEIIKKICIIVDQLVLPTIPDDYGYYDTQIIGMQNKTLVSLLIVIGKNRKGDWITNNDYNLSNFKDKSVTIIDKLPYDQTNPKNVPINDITMTHILNLMNLVIISFSTESYKGNIDTNISPEFLYNKLDPNASSSKTVYYTYQELENRNTFYAKLGLNNIRTDNDFKKEIENVSAIGGVGEQKIANSIDKYNIGRSYLPKYIIAILIILLLLVIISKLHKIKVKKRNMYNKLFFDTMYSEHLNELTII